MNQRLHQWTAYPLLGQDRAQATPDLLATPSLPMALPADFARQLYQVLVPGTTLLVTSLPAVRPSPAESECSRSWNPSRQGPPSRATESPRCAHDCIRLCRLAAFGLLATSASAPALARTPALATSADDLCPAVAQCAQGRPPRVAAGGARHALRAAAAGAGINGDRLSVIDYAPVHRAAPVGVRPGAPAPAVRGMGGAWPQQRREPHRALLQPRRQFHVQPRRVHRAGNHGRQWIFAAPGRPGTGLQ